jgi:hypothetical protein
VRVWDQDGRASAWSAPARFLTAAAPWRALWIAAEPDGPITAPASEAAMPPSSHYVLPLLRRAFRIDRPVRHAVVCLSGLGAHALTVNAREAHDTLLNPGWTDYRRTVLYETIDVTALLRRGDNTIGVRLGGGMYDVATIPGRYGKFRHSFGAPKLLLQLRIVHDDGAEQWIVSDEAWRTRPGPITFGSIFAGEDHDARREQSGWDQPGAADEGWAPVVLTSRPGGALRSQAAPGLKVMEAMPTVAVTRPAPGVAVHDLGRNFAGRPRLTVRGPSGATIRVTPGELLDEHGRVTQRSMGAGPDHAIRFTYTLGDRPGDQVWTPRFCYTGFRYLEVEGDGVVALDGEFIHAGLAPADTFQCSDRQVTAIHDVIRQAVRSNAMTVLTDCPHREKLGWLEQTWLNAATVFHTLDAHPLYAKITQDMLDAQQPNGMVPSIAPEYIRFVDGNGRDTEFRDSPEWGSAIVQSPWAAYRFTGDVALLARAYPAMRRYMAYLSTRVDKDGLLDHGLGDWYDIGPGPPGYAKLTTRAFTATAAWYADLTALAGIAALLDDAAAASAHAREAETVRAAMNARFFDPATARYDRDSQSALATALVLGLPPAGEEPRVRDRLVAAIHARDDHVSAGDIGFHYVVRALSEGGEAELLATMLAKTDAPSYGGQLRAGATALTEAWDADPTTSQNHFMLGHAMQWLYGGLAGISIDFARGRDDALVIAPQPVARIAAVAASLETVFGQVRSRWRRHGETSTLHVVIPAGATARIRLPGDPTTIRVGSGDHRFTMRAAPTIRAGP